jgi:hypothetical protein
LRKAGAIFASGQIKKTHATSSDRRCRGVSGETVSGGAILEVSLKNFPASACFRFGDDPFPVDFFPAGDLIPHRILPKKLAVFPWHTSIGLRGDG